MVTPISPKEVLLVALGTILLMLILFGLWFYVFVFSVEQAAAFKQAQAQAIDNALRAKYCTGGPYDNEIVRRFCTGK